MITVSQIFGKAICRIFLFLLIILLCQSFALGQETCKVKLKSIQGTYSGECLNNLASGHGKAVGVDSYEGEFKNGYPEGKGTYVWEDGHYFIGNFIKGNKSGSGEMYFESASGSDSIISGFWDKDNYIGKFAVPFQVKLYSSRINRVDCILRSRKGNSVSVTAKHRGGPTGINSTISLSYIKDISVISGGFKKDTDQPVNYASLKILEEISFPFEAIFYLSNGESTRILMNEKGTYEIFIDMN